MNGSRREAGVATSRAAARVVAAIPGRLLPALLGGLLLVLLVVSVWRARFEAPPPTLLLRDRRGHFLTEIRRGGPEAGYWPLPTLPPRVVAATLAVEDRRFYLHPGIDLAAAFRALGQNLRSGHRISGASTLAMQVARMQHPGPRTIPRKVVESTTALFLTLRYGREEILAQYLRLAPYGNSIHGIGYAARRYLDKPVEDLSWAETAFLTAIPQAPGRMNPFRPEGRSAAIARGERILELLHERGDLGGADLAVAREQIRSIAFPPMWRRPSEAMHPILRLERELQGWPDSNAPLLDTTIDLAVQEEAQHAGARHLRAWEDRGAGNIALMVVDPATREVIASVGSAGYFDDRHAGSIDYTQVPRSPGSLLKPFFYADALERGVITPATILDDVERGAGGVTNADERYLGPLLPRVALANSRNVPAVNLLARLGWEEGVSFLREVGFEAASSAAERAGLGLAIGGMPVTLEEAVRAYTVLASGGLGGELAWIRGAAPASTHVLSEETAREITLFLSDPQARLPSFPRMGATEYPFPVAVKTGTSTNYRDAWTVAYSRRWLVGVWVGHPASRPMDRLSGSLSAASLARQVLMALHPEEADGLADLSFPPPNRSHARRVCALTGQLATPACTQVFVEWFAQGQEPVDPCAAHHRVATDTRTGNPANARTPAGCVEVRSFVDLPPRYAAWATHAGLARSPAPADRRDPGGGVGGGDGLVRMKVTQPESGSRLLRDPETPPELATVALHAVVDPPVPEVVWYVDGAPYKVCRYPYTARWPITTGSHVIEARLANAAVVSNAVRVEVE